MQKLMSEIAAYMVYLEKTHGLMISVHLSPAKMRCLPGEIFEMLRPYNVHKNAYCAAVKRNGWEKCICVQEEIFEEREGAERFYHTCYAGVKEYVFRVFDKSETAAYIAVSGYRAEILPAGCEFPAMWENSLSPSKIPAAMLDAVIPPLVRMFERLFLFPMYDERQGEYNRMLQFLRERHGQASLQDLCKKFGRSKSYISHMFSGKCGMSIPAYCNELKLNYAKTLLENAQIPITEIALDAGYSDASYFILKFRRQFGFTPQEYRKNPEKGKTADPVF